MIMTFQRDPETYLIRLITQGVANLCQIREVEYFVLTRCFTLVFAAAVEFVHVHALLGGGHIQLHLHLHHVQG
mgnify:CR=1 FL=1